MSEATLILKPRKAKPFFLRHPWVFSGAVAHVSGAPRKGDVVTVTDVGGRFIGRGFFNPESQIVARLFCWNESEAVDDAFWRNRVAQAIRLRCETLRLPEASDAYRLAYSDADGLPGLIADRYGDYLTVQFLTAGMDARREVVLDALCEFAKPFGVCERADEETAGKEGIVTRHGILRGEAPEGVATIHCDGLAFLVDLQRGQKTGFFLDQRENRIAAARYMAGRRVLDGFTYTGGFAIAAARLGGAAEVVALDRSESALEMARRNAELNGANNIDFRLAKVSEALREYKKSGERFDAVILDPPKFARTRNGLTKALRAYHDVNLLAMQLLTDEGVLVTCSCSGHVGGHDFEMMLNGAAVEANRGVQILERRGASADHPVLAACPETAYLKCFICRVVR